VGELQSIGYNGQPVQQAFRRVDPPVTVLVDLAALFPREPHRAGGYNPVGLQMYSVVEGRLTCWGICEQGDWWGLVTYEIAYGTRRKSVTHWPRSTRRRRTLQCDELSRPVTDHHDGGVRSAAGDRRQDRSVDHPQVVDTADATLGVHDRIRVAINAHRCCARQVLRRGPRHRRHLCCCAD
jgi:hypothetical protein